MNPVTVSAAVSPNLDTLLIAASPWRT